MMKPLLVAAAIVPTLTIAAFAADNSTGEPNSTIRATTAGLARAEAVSPATSRANTAHFVNGYRGGVSIANRAPVYDPENSVDPDPRIGGSFKMNASGND